MFKTNKTTKFTVIDPKGTKVNHTKTRLTKSTGKLVDEQGKGRIGGPFQPTTSPTYLTERMEVFKKAGAAQAERFKQKRHLPITITLPDGSTKEGTSWETTPMDVAKGISSQMAKTIIVAEVTYLSRIDDEDSLVTSADGLDEEKAEDGATTAELWDMLRPLIGDCKLSLLKFDDKKAKAVFWHSSAHCLGHAMEKTYGCHLTHGPPIEGGFFYDCYMGDCTVSEKDFKGLDKLVQKQAKAKQTFDRLMLPKEDALEMFAYNPFKREYIATRIPDGGEVIQLKGSTLGAAELALTSCFHLPPGWTTVYRNGDFIDLCRGPHVPYSTMIQAFATHRNSSTNWLAKVENDPLQRVYGVSFPEKSQMKKWQEFQEQAKKRDHRLLGLKQELFFFHPLSPGSAFFLPDGTRLYNRLLEFIRREYWKRGFDEVTTPNIYNMKLWEQSGHALHYKENMFRFNIEGAEFGLKPMNCPGHCLMFGHTTRSYRELPLRFADFGVLHRNELSGALSGLTRVRRFCQDDAHIFCREDQITEEVLGSLDFMKSVYDIFGMTYKLELSTRPAKALGDMALWESAEAALAKALDAFAGPGNWRENPGDGAFYGPKIDIKVFDAMERVHQCATVQLDFQLPIRFNLRYRRDDVAVAGEAITNGEEAKGSSAQPGGSALTEGYQRPVMVHRAMLGSLERMIAILTEHFGGRWPFWLSPKQGMVVPVGQGFIDYAVSVKQHLHDAGFYVDVDDSTKTLNKKVCVCLPHERKPTFPTTILLAGFRRPPSPCRRTSLLILSRFERQRPSATTSLWLWELLKLRQGR
ncbi:unnamed protein product [Chrysoparadoxa australica]